MSVPASHEEECMVCLQSDRHVVCNDRLPMKYCDCIVRSHVVCWMRALDAMKGRRFCLICDLEHWEKCWHAAQNAAVRRVLFSIMGIYLCIGALYLLVNSTSGKKDE